MKYIQLLPIGYILNIILYVCIYVYIFYFNCNFTFYLTVLKVVKSENSKHKPQSSVVFSLGNTKKMH